jgi:hypothetical protein
MMPRIVVGSAVLSLPLWALLMATVPVQTVILVALVLAVLGVYAATRPETAG